MIKSLFGPSCKIATQPASLDLLARNSDVTTTRRTARLDGTEGLAIAALTALVAEAESKTGGPDVWLSSFREALKKFVNFDDTTGFGEQIVNLATSLEELALGTNEGEGLTLRLCTRVTALLAHDDDPAAVLFEDLKQLYSLRSSIVHGGEVSVKSLNGKLRALACVPSEKDEENTLVRLGYAVDRLRDIVRRTVLARICLASGEQPSWPFKEKGKEARSRSMPNCPMSPRAMSRLISGALFTSFGLIDIHGTRYRPWVITQKQRRGTPRCT